jgi:hypothetical protein
MDENRTDLQMYTEFLKVLARIPEAFSRIRHDKGGAQLLPTGINSWRVPRMQCSFRKADAEEPDTGLLLTTKR